MFDLAEIMRSEHPKDEVLVLGSGKFGAVITGTVVIGIGTHLSLPYWLTIGTSGTVSWRTEEAVKDLMEKQVENKEREKIKQSDDQEDKKE